MGRGGARRFRTRHAQRDTYVQLHVERASPRHLSRWRFTEFALSEPRISCELIADGHHVSDDVDENVVSRKRPAWNLSRNGCNRGRWAAEWIAVLAFWEGLHRGRWRLFTCRPLSACR